MTTLRPITVVKHVLMGEALVVQPQLPDVNQVG